jgi:tRNA nucleotidyltransferase (CCA-adding enzyme)
VQIILSHQNADFDALASMLGATKLFDHALPVLPERMNRNVNEFLALYRSALPFVNWQDIRIDSIERVILTDTQTSPYLKAIEEAHTEKLPIDIIEHHTLKKTLRPHERWHEEKVGAITTWMVEEIRDRAIEITALEATLLALGIYEDTGMLTYCGTTTRDVDAVAWLLRRGAALDTIRRFLSHPLNDAQQKLFEMLMDTATSRRIHGYNITLAHAHADEVVSEINSVTARLRDILDPTGLFVLVKMPHGVQLVCRSTHDAVNVSLIAKHFKGGGHTRAAAATIYKQSLDAIQQTIWEKLYTNIRPAVRVGDLMSYGVQTVNVDEQLMDIIQHIRRIGHEGYPVIDAEKNVVGLLSLRDADRALEHGLNTIVVSDIMQSGTNTLQPNDSVSQLEQTMVQSGWGQIPIVDEQEKIIGIVTRTDLINHWASTHPRDNNDPQTQPNYQVDAILGEDIHHLIQMIAQHAQEHASAIYLVGGVVRDLLLKRPNYDIDFVLEDDAIAFANLLCERYGGRIHSYKPFGTAKWHLNDDVAHALGLDSEQNLPDHIDFATARSELYTHPTALPTVYQSGIKLDLRRRDFTINTLAIQLSPTRASGRLHDYYGGLHDLNQRLIRVLHSLSFIDDPTRILRAIRFSERLQFSIEIRTTELIISARPMLERITGERVRNELTLLFQEEHAKRGWQKLHALGILQAIHPDFKFDDTTLQHWESFHQNDVGFDMDAHTQGWCIIMASIEHERVKDVCERLLFGRRDTQRFYEIAYLVQEAPYLRNPDAKPSYITQALNGVHESSWRIALHLLEEHTLAYQRLQNYAEHWRHLCPYTDGNTLKAMGVSAGPIYRTVLDTLRDAWLDGKIQNKADEQTMLKELIAQHERDGQS